jgi:cyclopropane fatty-acyl-phospholipid synthase-like methyltransferase
MLEKKSLQDQEAWEKFAQENAEFYILTHKHVDFNSDQGKEYFFKTGIEDTQVLLSNALPFIGSKERALEIGAGIGRLALAHAHVFKELVAVDISKTMLEKLSAMAFQTGISNIRTCLSDEPWDLQKPYNYIYSFIVFQHIAEFKVIEHYIHRIAGSLASDGIAQLHFDTRPASVVYRLRNILPDILLPSSQRKNIRRTRREASELRKIFRDLNLQILQEINPDSANHFFLLRPGAE